MGDSTATWQMGPVLDNKAVNHYFQIPEVLQHTSLRNGQLGQRESKPEQDMGSSLMEA